MDEKVIAAARTAYPAGRATITLGAVVHEGEIAPEPLVGIPLSMMNRHGLVAGATGTGKTKTLQLMAEQLSRAGVPVFLYGVLATTVRQRTTEIVPIALHRKGCCPDRAAEVEGKDLGGWIPAEHQPLYQ